jgi:high-affinity nickel-transport protein
MGNFSVNHYSRLEVQSGRILIHYFIDLAEIPTYQELQEANITGSSAAALDAGATNVTQFVQKRGEELGNGLSLAIDGQTLRLHMLSSGVIFPPGAGGLPTMKMGFVYEAAFPRDLDLRHVEVRYADHNYQGHSGWKEIVAAATFGKLTSSTVPATDRSRELSNYPTDLLHSPPQSLEAVIEAALPQPAAVASTPRAASIPTPALPGSPSMSARSKHVSNARAVPDAVPGNPLPSPSLSSSTPHNSVSLKANEQPTPRSRFTELITSQHLSVWFLFTAAIIALGLGALHALEPGHGKTIVAAYLVGSRGTARHAVLLGLIVTAAHTAGVFALGGITLYASRYIVPEQLYPWLGFFSGITIAILGGYMFLRRWTGTAVDHSHASGSSHLHWFASKRKANEDVESSQAALEEGVSRHVSLTQLFTLGITGGIIPCPAALIVLLSAFALHRVALGFFLIVAFSLGLAAVLIAFGMLMVYAHRFISRLRVDGPLTTRWLPLASSAFITILGSGLAIQAFATTHFSIQAFSVDRIGPILFVAGLGLILGMRHSTDADHVVAISTIVSKQKSIRGAALIGSIWGLGHTITIFVVGSLIILFGVTIPPRIGLSMEFSVALMLILLGVLNLSGVMKRITTHFTPASAQASIQTDNAPLLPAPSKIRGRFRTSIHTFGWYQCIRPLAIGLVHGLAGSAAVALLVLSTIHNPYWASAYLIIFGVGTMVGMMCMTAAIALPLTYAGDRFSKLSNFFGVASGMVSLCFGSFLVYQLGFLGGLFTSHPQWIPQ